MPIELYETMFVLDAGKMATEADATKAAVHGLIEKHGGEILVSRPWNENQKLAYPIKKQKKGYFHIIYYKFESTKQQALESDIRLSSTEYMLRHLTSHIDPRYAEVMLQIAKDEQGSAFALRGMHDEPSPTDLTPATINDPAAAAAPGADIGPVPNLNGGPAGGGPRGARGPRRAEAADKPE
jgi:small subunit ribosomal protein S6